MDSKTLAQKLMGSRMVLVDGPFGRPLKLGNIRAISTAELYHDVLFPLREARRKGFDVTLECIDQCNVNFPLKESMGYHDCLRAQGEDKGSTSRYTSLR